MHDVDVVVAGGGPTGLLLAAELRLAGVDVLVLEQRAEPDPVPRANGLPEALTRRFGPPH